MIPAPNQSNLNTANPRGRASYIDEHHQKGMRGHNLFEPDHSQQGFSLDTFASAAMDSQQRPPPSSADGGPTLAAPPSLGTVEPASSDNISSSNASQDPESLDRFGSTSSPPSSPPRLRSPSIGRSGKLRSPSSGNREPVWHLLKLTPATSLSFLPPPPTLCNPLPPPPPSHFSPASTLAPTPPTPPPLCKYMHNTCVCARLRAFCFPMPAGKVVFVFLPKFLYGVRLPEANKPTSKLTPPTHPNCAPYSRKAPRHPARRNPRGHR